MNDLLQKAKERLEKIQQQQRMLQVELDELASFLKTARRLSDGENGLEHASSMSRTLPLPISSHGTKGSTILGTVREILAGGKTLPTRYLLNELEGRGVAVTGTDAGQKVITLSSMLSRNKEEFKNDRANGWSLRK